MSRWFRFYEGALDDPKVQALPGDLFKAWVNLLCVAARNDGALPAADIPFMLRLDDRKAGKVIDELVSRGLIDRIGDGLEPHNWASRQFKSDVSNDRVKRHRQRHGNGKRNVTETPQVTPPETEQIQNRGEKKDNISSQPEGIRDEFDQLEAALRKAAGAQNNPSPKLFDLSPILKLIDGGVSLERVILPKLRGLAAAGKTFRSWQYPAQIITDELAQQGKTVVPTPEDDERWKSRLGHGRNRKIWATSQWGPPPNQPGCRVPAHLIQPTDGDGWQDWKPEAA